MQTTQTENGPRIGYVVNVRGVPCEIIAIHAAGTIDVQEINGSRCWRISGLWGSTATAINRAEGK